jgi:hypothetical protein
MNETEIGLKDYYYLEDFNLINCISYKKTLDFSSCPQIKNINLIGSQTTGISLPFGGVVQELRIPTTITSLKLEQ